MPFLERGLSPLLGIAAPVAVYETDGRIYGVALLLYLPATIVLHRRRAAASGGTGTAGFVLVLCALVATGVGAAGDHWADGAGYTLERPGSRYADASFLLGCLLVADRADRADRAGGMSGRPARSP